MRKGWKRWISVLLSAVLLLGWNGMVSNPMTAQADEPRVEILMDGTVDFDNESSVTENETEVYLLPVVYTVSGEQVTVTVREGLGVDGDTLFVDGTSNAAILGALSNSIYSVSGFDYACMQFALTSTIGGSTTSCPLAYDPSTGVFTRADRADTAVIATGANGELGEYHLSIVLIQPLRRNVQISISNSDANWRGVPAIYQSDFPYEEDNETVNWNYNSMHSYKYCTLYVNNPDLDSKADFNDASTKTVSYEVNAERPGYVNLTFCFDWNYRPASNTLTINGHDYIIPVNFDDRASWLNAFAFEYRDRWISFTISDVELDYTNSGDATLDITNFNLRPITLEECYIGEFSWRSTPEREGSDDCIPHSNISLISVTYPDGIENGRSFDEATLDAESRLSKTAKTAKYITYGATDGNGEMMLPIGSKVTLRVAPEFGYQITAFKLNGTPIESSDISTGSDVAVFTFTVGWPVMNLSADVLQVGNEAVTANTKAVSEAGIELGGNESAMKIGTAKLELEDFTPSPDQENRFRTAAGDYEVMAFLDISLFNCVYKGTSAAFWDMPVKTLNNKATVYLALEEDVSDKEILVVHENAEGDYETIEAKYLAEIGVIAFETNSVGNYAIAGKENGPSKDLDLSWYDNSGKSYWYENGVRQGTAADAKAVSYDGTVRGREIYDPAKNAWFWLDADAEGAMARDKEVFVPYVYQDEKKWTTQTMRDVSYESDKEVYYYIYKCMISGEGKWTRYDSSGKLVKGWYTVDESQADIYPEQVGNTYYYDHMTGAMVKGYVTIDGKRYHFDERTGVLTD